jgi:23S rRNA (cytidine1920-2'-O)/16S rRNA (cytidine1409-2'-O)-methyltransferase
MSAYVSRGGDKLASVAVKFGLDFSGKTVLDVGSSTGGFSDFALQAGASKIIAVEAGTNQLHPQLKADRRVELHEKTDIHDFKLAEPVDIVLIDVSFTSLRQILPRVVQLAGPETQVVALLKPQFEAEESDKNRGVIKNDRIRRKLIKDFEAWLKGQFLTTAKADSAITGSKGNLERFYLLKKL